MEEIKGLRKYELPPLPYKIDALEPYISKDIVDVHYNGHHKGYVNTANTLIDRLGRGHGNFYAVEQGAHCA